MQAPQINGETARHGYDGLLAHGSQGARAFAQDGQTLLHWRILRLEAHHAPGAPYHCGAEPRITALGHAAWHALAATAAFARTKPGVRTDGATIVEPMQSQISRVSTTLVSLPTPRGRIEGAEASSSLVRALICCCKLKSAGRAVCRRVLIQAGRCRPKRVQLCSFHQWAGAGKA